VDHSIQNSATVETFTFPSELEDFTSAGHHEIGKHPGGKIVNEL
jgi:hypothetical protein